MTDKWVTPVILALDLGTNLGWAMHSDQGVQSGVLSLKEKGKFSSHGFRALYSWLTAHKTRLINECVGTSTFTLLVEVPHCGKFMAANRILFGLLAIVNMFADANDLKLVEYRPKAIKKYWTRNGNADKKQMVARTQSFGYIDVKDHNESDAIAMLYFHLKGVK